MQGHSGGKSAVSESAATITAHGGIVEMTMPEGFDRVRMASSSQMHNYLEHQARGSSIRICYEEMNEPLMDEDIAEMEKLFAEPVSDSRELNLYGDPNGRPDDSMVYGALCQSFVYGGALMRGGSIIDMDNSTWEIQNVGGKTVLSARLQFISSSGSPSKREARLIMAQPPSAGGCSYMWLEGTSAEVNQFEPAFMNAVASGSFKKL